MSNSNKTFRAISFARNDSGWADFFITRIGLILFAAILLLAAFRIYPMYQEREIRSDLDVISSDLSSKIESVDSTSIPGYRYNYVFDDKNSNYRLEISSEYVVAHGNVRSFIFGDHEITHAEPLIAYVYPSNGNWNNVSGFRKYVSDTIGHGKNGDVSSPLDLHTDKNKIDLLFNSIEKELALTPFIPDNSRPVIIEKVIIYYKNDADIQERDYVFLYQ